MCVLNITLKELNIPQKNHLSSARPLYGGFSILCAKAQNTAPYLWGEISLIPNVTFKMGRARPDYRLRGAWSEMDGCSQSDRPSAVKLYETPLRAKAGKPDRSETCIRRNWRPGAYWV